MCNGTYRGLVSAQTDPLDVLEDDSQGVSEVSGLDVDVYHELQGRFLCLGHQSAIFERANVLTNARANNEYVCVQIGQLDGRWGFNDFVLIRLGIPTVRGRSGQPNVEAL